MHPKLCVEVSACNWCEHRLYIAFSSGNYFIFKCIYFNNFYCEKMVKDMRKKKKKQSKKLNKTRITKGLKMLQKDAKQGSLAGKILLLCIIIFFG